MYFAKVFSDTRVYYFVLTRRVVKCVVCIGNYNRNVW